jgi:hypothetical protein
VSVSLFGRYRIEELQKRRRRLHPERLWSLDRECRQRSCAEPDHDGIAANPKDVFATNFGQPAEAFEIFPDRDVFIAGKDGAR